METLGSLWNYQENFDELKLKLQYTAIELESVKMEANEQIRKYREEVKHLINLLKLACHERDEARDKLQKLLNKLIMPSSPTDLQHPILLQSQSESPLLIAAKANSSITESSSLSDTYNHQSHGSPTVDSFFDAVTSPDFSSINSSVSTGLVSLGVTKVDLPATTVISNLVKGKILPQKGKLLQAVMEAGPLLQTLLVAGPLPRWRNPPPLRTFKIPPVSIKGCHSKSVNQKPASNPNTTIVQKQLNSSPSSYPEMSRGARQSCSAAMLNFATPGSASGLTNSQLLSAGAGFNSQITAGKRQRFQ